MKLFKIILIFALSLTSIGTALSMEIPRTIDGSCVALFMLESSINKCIEHSKNITKAINEIQKLLRTNGFSESLANDIVFNKQIIARLKQKFSGNDCEIALGLNTYGALGALPSFAQKIKEIPETELSWRANEHAYVIRKVRTELAVSIFAIDRQKTYALLQTFETIEGKDKKTKLIQKFLMNFLSNARNHNNPEHVLPLTKERVRFMIDLGADLNDTYQQTRPLMKAVESKFPELVQILLENGADPFDNSAGQTALDYVKQYQHYIPIKEYNEMTKLLLYYEKQKLI